MGQFSGKLHLIDSNIFVTLVVKSTSDPLFQHFRFLFSLSVKWGEASLSGLLQGSQAGVPERKWAQYSQEEFHEWFLLLSFGLWGARREGWWIRFQTTCVCTSLREGLLLRRNAGRTPARLFREPWAMSACPSSHISHANLSKHGGNSCRLRTSPLGRWSTHGYKDNNTRVCSAIFFSFYI